MIRSDRRSQSAIAVFCALWLAGPSALSRAAESDEAGARVLFAEGRRLVDAGNYTAACLKFEDSFRLEPGVGTNFNLADCFEHIGRTASAWARFLDVAAATKAAGQVERERVARWRAAVLEPGLARMIVEVSSAVDGLVVERDGIAIGQGSWGIAVPVDPGVHVVEATAPDKRRWSQSVTVPEAPTTVSVSVPELEAAPREEPPSPSPILVGPAVSGPVSSAEPTRRWSIPAVGLASLGVVALGTGAVFAFQLQSENGEAKALCPSSTCRTVDEKTRHDMLVSDAYRDRRWAFVGAGIGGAALLAAAYLWWGPIRRGATRAPAGRLSAGAPTGIEGIGAHLELECDPRRRRHLLAGTGGGGLLDRRPRRDRRRRRRRGDAGEETARPRQSSSRSAKELRSKLRSSRISPMLLRGRTAWATRHRVRSASGRAGRRIVHLRARPF
jgi:hypothetical protein